jgi:hypothetical protein
MIETSTDREAERLRPIAVEFRPRRLSPDVALFRVCPPTPGSEAVSAPGGPGKMASRSPGKFEGPARKTLYRGRKQFMIYSMNIAFFTAAPDEASPDDPDRGQSEARARAAGGRDPGFTERRSRALQELAGIGMDIAKALKSQAESQANLAHATVDEMMTGRVDPGRAVMELAAAQATFLGRGGTDVGLIFERIARAVRRCWALEEHFFEKGRARDEKAESRGRARRNAAEPAPAGDARRRRRAEVGRIVEEAIANLPRSETARESIRNDLRERLDDEEACEDLIGDRPLGAIVAAICTDLGIEVDWSLWADEDWAIEEARTKPADSPYREYRPGRRADGAASPAADPPLLETPATGSDPP